MGRIYCLGIMLFFLIVPPVIAAPAKEETPTERRITYTSDWGPNLLDPRFGGKIVEVSSNGLLDIDGTKTLNDGFATEMHHWEPNWEAGPSHVIVRLGRTAFVGRIQFTTQSEGRGFPKSVKITRLGENKKALGAPIVVNLENSKVQGPSLEPPLEPSKFLKFDFGVDTYNVDGELEIGEIAVFEARGPFVLGFKGLLPGTTQFDRIKFFDGDEIYGKLTFRKGEIVIQPPWMEKALELKHSDIWGIRFKRASEDVPKAVLIFRTGEIITGNIFKEDMEFDFVGQKPSLDFRHVVEIGLTLRGKVKPIDKENRGLIELKWGDRFLVKTDVNLAIKPVTPSLVKDSVNLVDLNRIEPIKAGDPMRRLLYKTKEIVFARLNPEEPKDRLLKLSVGIDLQVPNSSIESYRAIDEKYVIPPLPFDILALKSGDLMIGKFSENDEIILQTDKIGKVRIKLDLIKVIRADSKVPGQFEILLQNGSIIHGGASEDLLTFTRLKDETSINISLTNIGLIDRFSKTRVNNLLEKIEKEDLSNDLTEVALYIFFPEKIGENLNAVIDRLKKREVWTFHLPMS